MVGMVPASVPVWRLAPSQVACCWSPAGPLLAGAALIKRHFPHGLRLLIGSGHALGNVSITGAVVAGNWTDTAEAWTGSCRNWATQSRVGAPPSSMCSAPAVRWEPRWVGTQWGWRLSSRATAARAPTPTTVGTREARSMATSTVPQQATPCRSGPKATGHPRSRTPPTRWTRARSRDECLAPAPTASSSR